MILIAILSAILALDIAFVYLPGRRRRKLITENLEVRAIMTEQSAQTTQHWTDGRTAQEVLDDRTQEAFEAAWITPNEELCAEIDRELGITPEPIAPTYEPRPITHELEESIQTHDGRTVRFATGLRAVDPAASLPEVRDGWRRDGEGTWTQVEEPIPHAQAALPRTLGQPEGLVDALKRNGHFA